MKTLKPCYLYNRSPRMVVVDTNGDFVMNRGDLTEAYVVKPRKPGDSVIIRINGEEGKVKGPIEGITYHVQRMGPSLGLKNKDMLTRISQEDIERIRKGETFHVEFEDDATGDPDQNLSLFNGKPIVYFDVE